MGRDRGCGPFRWDCDKEVEINKIMAKKTQITIDAPSKAPPYSTVTVNVTVRYLGDESSQSVRLRVYYELYPNDPVHFPAREILDEQFLAITWDDERTFSASFSMPSATEIGASVQAITDVQSRDDETWGDWFSDNQAQEVVELDLSGEVQEDECSSGDFYCLSDNAGENPAMVCQNGQWVRVENYPNCYVAYDFDKDEPVNGDYETPDGDDEELVDTIMKYTALGSIVFVGAMLVIPKKKRKGQKQRQRQRQRKVKQGNE